MPHFKFDAKHINEIVRRLLDTLPAGVTQLPKDIERNFHSVLQNAFARMNLVTREEFDAQRKVLERTRAKLERLEEIIKELK